LNCLFRYGSSTEPEEASDSRPGVPVPVPVAGGDPIDRDGKSIPNTDDDDDEDDAGDADDDTPGAPSISRPDFTPLLDDRGGEATFVRTTPGRAFPAEEPRPTPHLWKKPTPVPAGGVACEDDEEGAGDDDIVPL